MILFITRFGLAITALATFGITWSVFNTPAGVAAAVSLVSILSVVLSGAAMTEVHHDRRLALMSTSSVHEGWTSLDLTFAGLPPVTLPSAELARVITTAQRRAGLTLITPFLTSLSVWSSDDRVRFSVLAFGDILILNVRLDGTPVRYRILVPISTADELLAALT